MEDNPKQPSPTMLYVSNLPFSVDDEQLRGLFADFDVTTAYVAVRRNGRSKGFGFVNFSSEEEQRKALEKSDGLELEGRTLNVNVAHKDERRDDKGVLKDEFKTQRRAKGRGNQDAEPSTTIVYVSNLPFQFEDEDLVNLFEGLSVKNARVARRRNNRSKGFGFVEFESEEDQQGALKLDGSEIEGRQINVQPSRTTQVEKDPAQDQPEVNTNTAFVSNLPFQLEDEDLSKLFTEAGLDVKEARVARRGNGNSKGYGFVELGEGSTVAEAIEALNEEEVEGRTISVKDSTKRRGGRSNNGGQSNNRRNRKKRPSETLVYVSNLSFGVEDEELASLFDGLSIKSCHVARRPNGRSKGFGFVEFASNEDQQKALEQDGTEFKERTLTVQVAREVVEDEEEETNDNNDE